MNRPRFAATISVLAFAGLAAGCTTTPTSSGVPTGSSVATGSSEAARSSTLAGSTAPSASGLTVLEHIAATSAGLDAALIAFKAGDAAKAEQLAGDAYLEHFEFVEGPLEAIDAKLTEEVEDLIRDELRDAIKAGKSAAEIEGLIAEAKAGLVEATTKLQ